jgi:hypothetical protein
MTRRISLFAIVAALACSTTLIRSAPVPEEKKSKLAEADEATAAGGDADAQFKQKAASNYNLKQIALAMHNYASANGDKLAQDIVDKDGKPLLSWRIDLLRFLEEDKLYKEFRRHEPWDSPTNIKLLEKIPKVFESPRAKTKKGYTVYQGFEGNGAIFKSMYSIGNIPDGTSNTILCVEATHAVPWTRPGNIPFDPNKDLPKFGKAFGEKPCAALCDGSTREINLKTVSAETLKNAICGNDGNVLGNDW